MDRKTSATNANENTRIPVAYLLDNYKDPFAGTEGQLYKLIESITQFGYAPKLVLFRPSEYIERHGFLCKVEILGIQRLGSFKSIWSLLSLAVRLRREGIRLVHIFFNDPSIIAPVFLKPFGIKVVISRRDMGYWYSPNTLKILRFNRHFLDGAIVNSQAVKDITHNMERIPLEKIHVIYNGYSTVNTAWTETTKDVENEGILAAIKQQNVVSIGLLANVRPIKRMQDAIEALALIKNPKIALVIMGAGDPHSLSVQAQNLGVSNQVYFTGALSQPEIWLSKIDIGILCSESEGFSNAIIEYMQHKLPVVCSAVGGNTEIVENDITGYLYKVGDVHELAEKLSHLVNSKEKREKFGIAGQQKVINMFHLEKMVAAHAKLYQSWID